jgi:lipopolysaccharide export system permease protein
MYLIYRHLLRSAAGPFAFGFFVITFLLMIDILYKYIDLFVSKGVPFTIATKVLALSLGHTFALSVPMAVLIAILMSVGQLAADHEITAMKASGISLWAVLAPLLLGAGGIALGLTAYNHFVFPESNHTLANLLYDIGRKKPMLEIREQMFTDLSDRMTIFVKSKDDLTGRIEDVTIFEKKEPSDPSPRLTTAAWGRIIAEHEADAMLIELHDGEIHEVPDTDEPLKYQIVRFRQHDLYLTEMERDFRESDRKARSDREMNLTDLWHAAAAEQVKQDKVAARVAEIGGKVVDAQWQLLDPSTRAQAVGIARGQHIAHNEAYRAKKIKATRRKVEMAADQMRYQEKIRDSYRVRENRYLVEFHKKFAIPFACVVFALLGVPMAVTTSRSGKGVSVSMALAVYLIYYLFLVGGEKFADRGKLDPALAMWMANLVLVAIGIPIFWRTLREGRLFSFTLRPPRPRDQAGQTPR